MLLYMYTKLFARPPILPQVAKNVFKGLGSLQILGERSHRRLKIARYCQVRPRESHRSVLWQEKVNLIVEAIGRKSER